MVEIVTATEEMLIERYGEMPPLPVHAIAAVDGDRTLGLAGYLVSDHGALLFAGFTDELRAKPRVLIRGARRLLSDLKAQGCAVLAKCDYRIEAAERFLRHLGFEHSKDDVFIWKVR